jgi:hypothetical protein
MTTSIDAPSSQAHDTGLLSTATSEVADFGEAVFHSGLENPINGALQVVNHVTGARLPELHLVDSDRVSQSVGGKLGTIVGAAADVYALTMATGGLGGAGYLVSAARMGAVGATYAGVLQPSAPDSKNFYADRFTNAAVSGVTFASMGAGAAALDTLGIFAAPAARSFMGSTTYGALSGAVGGAASSEANAVIKQGRVLPTLPDFISNVGSYSAFGAAFGGIGYGVNRLMSAKPETVAGDNNDVSAAGDKTIRPQDTDAKPASSPQDSKVGAAGSDNGGPKSTVPEVTDKTIGVQDAEDKPATTPQDSKAGAAGSDNGGPKSTAPEVTDKTPYTKLLSSSDQPSSHQVDNADGSARATLDDSGTVRQAEAVFRDGDGGEFRITATAESKIAEFWRRHILISFRDWDEMLSQRTRLYGTVENLQTGEVGPVDIDTVTINQRNGAIDFDAHRLPHSYTDPTRFEFGPNSNSFATIARGGAMFNWLHPIENFQMADFMKHPYMTSKLPPGNW